MARLYRLIASNKANYVFCNEEVISITDPFKSLEEVDFVTCRYNNQFEFLNTLDKDVFISNKDYVSIQYTHNKENKYLHPLFGCPSMINIINQLKEINTYVDGHPVKYKIVPYDNPFFQRKLAEFYYYLGSEPRLFFSEVYGDKTPKELERLVYLYYDGKGKEFYTLEDEYEWKELKNKIELEFSRYKIFRGYLIYMDRYLKKHPELIRKSFEKTNKTAVTEINDLPFDPYEKEEFLTEKEYEQVIPNGDEWYHAPKRF